MLIILLLLITTTLAADKCTLRRVSNCERLNKRTDICGNYYQFGFNLTTGEITKHAYQCRTISGRTDCGSHFAHPCIPDCGIYKIAGNKGIVCSDYKDRPNCVKHYTYTKGVNKWCYWNVTSNLCSFGSICHD